MSITARLPFAARRNEIRTWTMRFVGVDWSASDFRAQVRLRPDTPGDPLIDLATVGSSSTEGLKIVGVTTEDGVPVTTVTGRINKTTMSDADVLPYPGEPGADIAFAWALQVDGVTRIVGEFWALASVMDSDAAPALGTSGYGVQGSGVSPFASASLTISAGDVIEVSVDGADLAAASAASAAISATEADAARDEILAALASISNTHIIAVGVPGDNVGINGQFYTDSATGITYGPKTAGAWPLDAITNVNAHGSRIDMRAAGAVFPTGHWTFTRNSVSTDLLYTDPYDYAFTTYGVDVPIMRVGLGHGEYMKAQQLLAAPGAPVNETVTVANGGIYIITAWGPGGSNAQCTLGTATGTFTGGGNLAGNAGAYMVFTCTGNGTINFVPTGGLTKANITFNPDLPTISEPVPYIATQSTRQADKAVHTSTLIALLNTAAAYLTMGISNVTGRSYSRAATPLGINGVSAGYFVNDTSFIIYDPANNNTTASLGGGSARAGVTLCRTWDASATVDFGGGDKFETSHPFHHNNNAAVTAARLGDNAAADTYGAAMLNGFIGWYEFGTGGRVSAEALYSLYTSTPPPTLDSLLKNYTGPAQFPKFLTAIELLKAGVTDHVKIGIAGPSHEAGVAAGTNIRGSAWMTQMVADLSTDTAISALGLAVTDDTFNGTSGVTFGSGVNAYDPRLTYAGTAPSLAGVQYGGDVIVIPAGGKLTFTPTRTTSRFVLGVYTAASGYGSVKVSSDGGTTPLAATETGLTSNPTTAAASLITRTFNQTLGSNAWTIEAVGNPVHVSFGYATNPLLKQLVFFNGARSGFDMAALAQDSAPESSYLLPMRTLAFSLVIGGVEQTNDMVTPTAWPGYDTSAQAFIVNTRLNGDFFGLTDPPSSTAVYTQAVQDKVVNQARASFGKAAGGVLPYYDFNSWKAGLFAPIFAMGYYDTDTVHLYIRGQKRAKANQIGVLLKRLLAAA